MRVRRDTNPGPNDLWAQKERTKRRLLGLHPQKKQDRKYRGYLSSMARLPETSRFLLLRDVEALARKNKSSAWGLLYGGVRMLKNLPLYYEAYKQAANLVLGKAERQAPFFYQNAPDLLKALPEEHRKAVLQDVKRIAQQLCESDLGPEPHPLDPGHAPAYLLSKAPLMLNDPDLYAKYAGMAKRLAPQMDSQLSYYLTAIADILHGIEPEYRSLVLDITHTLIHEETEEYPFDRAHDAFLEKVPDRFSQLLPESRMPVLTTTKSLLEKDEPLGMSFWTRVKHRASDINALPQKTWDYILITYINDPKDASDVFPFINHKDPDVKKAYASKCRRFY